MLDQPLSGRLQSKSVKQSIVSTIARDFSLTPVLAEAYFSQISNYFLHYAEVELGAGQFPYLAVDENEPAGKPIALCKKVSVKLTLHNPEEDLPVYKKFGLRGLRHHKIIRITNEAIDQGGVLSYEDIAFSLTTSVVTVKRDMSQMRKKGNILPSRGWRHEMERGQKHKTQILELYLSGYQFSDIERRTKHSESAINRYLQDFARVALLHKKAFTIDQIRISTGFSHRLINEYLQLFAPPQEELPPPRRSLMQMRMTIPVPITRIARQDSNARLSFTMYAPRVCQRLQTIRHGTTGGPPAGGTGTGHLIKSNFFVATFPPPPGGGRGRHR